MMLVGSRNDPPVEMDGVLAELDALELAAPLVVMVLCVLGVPLLLQLKSHQLLLIEPTPRIRVENAGKSQSLRCATFMSLLNRLVILVYPVSGQPFLPELILLILVVQPHNRHSVILLTPILPNLLIVIRSFLQLLFTNLITLQ
jgi:hypothetical protein